VLSLLVCATVASAQNPDPSKWMCRNLADSGGFTYQGETILGSQACRPIQQMTPNESKPVGLGEEQQESKQVLNSLVGTLVTVQRMPLCRPGTYSVVLSYAGKQAKVVSTKPSKIAPVSQAVMESLTPQARAMIEDGRNAASVLVQFDDGTQLDTCVPILPSKLSDYFELASGQTLQPVAQDPITPTHPALQPELLSGDEVKLAMSGNARSHWVFIEDEGFMAAQGNQVPAITLLMPEAVLAIQSDSAKKQFTQYVPSEEDKRRSLMIVAQGYAGKTIAEGCTSITRIVLLSDRSGGVVQEAYLSEPLGETWRNGFGATNECQSLRVKFSLADVHKVRAAAPNGEFLVAVFAGSVNTKVYKVKRKHQSKLGLE
jgi:hypothetical protein